MPEIIVSLVIFLLGLWLIETYGEKLKEDTKLYVLCGLVFLSIFARLKLAFWTSYGDTGDFANMMKRLTTEGFYGIYENGGINYPPLFQYLYFGIAKLLQLFGVPFDPKLRMFVLAVKLPCMLCEYAMIALVYRRAEQIQSEAKKLSLAYVLLLNPGYVFATSFLCQVDALYVCLMFLTVLLLMDGRLKTAYFVFAASILMKFQACFITPVIAFAIVDQVFLKNFNWKRFWQNLIAGLVAIACMALCYLPFVVQFETNTTTRGGFTDNFSSTIKGFGKASQNAYNFWTLVGYNEVPQTEYFGPFTCQTWGVIFIVLLVISSTLLYWRGRGKREQYPLLAAYLVFGTYCFSVRMMSRYAYAAVILLLLAYAIKPTKERKRCSYCMVVGFYLEIVVEYAVYPWYTYKKGMVIPFLISAAMVALFGSLLYTLQKETKGGSIAWRKTVD
ncbi:MAG: hypothetical protein ACI4HI_18665 [Lachnospiraceae bacterium]